MFDTNSIGPVIFGKYLYLKKCSITVIKKLKAFHQNNCDKY